jgi:hypothetical protein
VDESPDRYAHPPLDDRIDRRLDELAEKTGTAWPDRDRRLKKYAGLFGAPPVSVPQDTGSQFSRLTAGLRDAASRFMNPKLEDNADGLRLAFAQEIRKTREYLQVRMLDGTPVKRRFDETREVFDTAIDILSSETVAGAFKRSAPDEGWAEEGSNGRAAALVSEITQELQPDTTGLIEADEFMALQDIAYHGAATLAKTLTVNLAHEDDLDELMKSAYTWKTSIDSLGSPG